MNQQEFTRRLFIQGIGGAGGDGHVGDTDEPSAGCRSA